jgi:hypothetical protein
MNESEQHDRGGQKNWHAPNSKFSSSVAKSIISFLLGALTAAFIWGGKTQQLTDLLVWKGETEATLKRMDEQGTYKSQWNISTERTDIVNNTNRIVEVEKQVKKIDLIEATVARIEKKLDETVHK